MNVANSDKKTILLVENSRTTRHIMLQTLMENGYEVIMAKNGAEAIDLATKADLILMDLYMPALNGYEAAAKIRELDDEKAKEIPIIAFTASHDAGDITLCHKVGINEFVKKSAPTEQLLNKIKARLNLH